MESNQFIKISGHNPVSVKWDNRPIPDKIYQYLRQHFWAANSYGHLPVGEMTAIITAADAATGGGLISLDAAYSIYHLTIKAKIMSGYRRMNNCIDGIGRAYDRGADILMLSAKYDFPPLNLLRGILLRTYDDGKIYNIFAAREPPESVLAGRDLAQFRLALANDADSVIDAQAIAKTAQANEDIFVDWVKQWQPKIRTQNELAAEQVEQFGRAIITPDLLFAEPVYINGEKIHWIDFKSYVGCDVQFIAKSNQRQAARYSAKWGKGALCYQLGFVDGLKVGDAMILSCAGLGINFDNSLFR